MSMRAIFGVREGQFICWHERVLQIHTKDCKCWWCLFLHTNGLYSNLDWEVGFCCSCNMQAHYNKHEFLLVQKLKKGFLSYYVVVFVLKRWVKPPTIVQFRQWWESFVEAMWGRVHAKEVQFLQRSIFLFVIYATVVWGDFQVIADLIVWHGTSK